jgi:ubiquinone/menaquinone biosynthesis C-methylase UbiE
VNSTANVEPDSRTAPGYELPAARDSRPLSVAEGYVRWAPIYDHTPNPLLAREERCLLPLLPDLHNKCVLDLACGTGRWLEELMARGGESAFGLDCSISMLRVAGTKRAIAGRFACADCENLPFPAQVFHLAICSFALGHIQRLDTMVRELARVLKPGGEVFLSDLHPEAYARGWRVGFRHGSEAVQIETWSRSIEEIVQTFSSNGFAGLTRVSLRLGEPEKHIFTLAGKERAFEATCRIPAILVFRFKRLGITIER